MKTLFIGATALIASGAIFAQQSDYSFRDEQNLPPGHNMYSHSSYEGQFQRSGAFNQSEVKRLNKSSNLVGSEVRLRNNEKVGTVKDVVIDFQSGRVAYIVVDANELLHGDRTHIAVPATALQVQSDQRHLTLEADRSHLQQVRRFTEWNLPPIRSQSAQMAQWQQGQQSYNRDRDFTGRYRDQSNQWSDPYSRNFQRDDSGQSGRGWQNRSRDFSNRFQTERDQWSDSYNNTEPRYGSQTESRWQDRDRDFTSRFQNDRDRGYEIYRRMEQRNRNQDQSSWQNSDREFAENLQEDPDFYLYEWYVIEPVTPGQNRYSSNQRWQSDDSTDYGSGTGSFGQSQQQGGSSERGDRWQYGDTGNLESEGSYFYPGQNRYSSQFRNERSEFRDQSGYSDDPMSHSDSRYWRNIQNFGSGSGASSERGGSFQSRTSRNDESSASGTQQFSGWIRDIDEENKTITIEGENRTLIFKLSDDATIQKRGGRSGNMYDLEEGDQAEVTYDYQSGSNQARRVRQ